MIGAAQIVQLEGDVFDARCNACIGNLLVVVVVVVLLLDWLRGYIRNLRPIARTKLLKGENRVGQGDDNGYRAVRSNDKCGITGLYGNIGDTAGTVNAFRIKRICGIGSQIHAGNGVTHGDVRQNAIRSRHELVHGRVDARGLGVNFIRRGKEGGGCRLLLSRLGILHFLRIARSTLLLLLPLRRRGNVFCRSSFLIGLLLVRLNLLRRIGIRMILRQISIGIIGGSRSLRIRDRDALVGICPLRGNLGLLGHLGKRRHRQLGAHHREGGNEYHRLPQTIAEQSRSPVIHFFSLTPKDPGSNEAEPRPLALRPKIRAKALTVPHSNLRQDAGSKLYRPCTAGTSRTPSTGKTLRPRYPLQSSSHQR